MKQHMTNYFKTRYADEPLTVAPKEPERFDTDWALKHALDSGTYAINDDRVLNTLYPYGWTQHTTFKGIPVLAVEGKSFTAQAVSRGIGGVFSGGHILVDDSFFDLSDNAQAYVLYHEYGHIQDPHADTFAPNAQELRQHTASHGYVLPAEARADLYACQQLGKARTLLAMHEVCEYSYDMLRSQFMGIFIAETCQKEFLLRMKLIGHESTYDGLRPYLTI